MSDKLQKQNWLDAILTLVGMTPAQLSKQSGLDQGLISRLRHDLTRPTHETLAAIADATELPLELVYRKAGLLPQDKEEIDEWAVAQAIKLSKLPADSKNFIEQTIRYFLELEKKQDKK